MGGVELRPDDIFPRPPLHPSRAVSLTQRETQTCQVEWSDFLKFCVGGVVERYGEGGEGGGGERAEPALWANGKEVGEAWVSPVGESGHQRGHPWSSSFSSPLPLSEVPHFFPGQEKALPPWHCQTWKEGVSRR